MLRSLSGKRSTAREEFARLSRHQNNIRTIFLLYSLSPIPRPLLASRDSAGSSARAPRPCAAARGRTGVSTGAPPLSEANSHADSPTQSREKERDGRTMGEICLHEDSGTIQELVGKKPRINPSKYKNASGVEPKTTSNQQRLILIIKHLQKRVHVAIENGLKL